jgi:hypothetical protein
MADYRDPKVTTTGKKQDTGKWIGIAVAVLVVLLLIAWWAGAFNGAEEVEPVVETPTTEAPATPPATEGTTPPATEGTTTEPAAPAQQ